MLSACSFSNVKEWVDVEAALVSLAHLHVETLDEALDIRIDRKTEPAQAPLRLIRVPQVKDVPGALSITPAPRPKPVRNGDDDAKSARQGAAAQQIKTWFKRRHAELRADERSVTRHARRIRILRSHAVEAVPASSVTSPAHRLLMLIRGPGSNLLAAAYSLEVDLTYTITKLGTSIRTQTNSDSFESTTELLTSLK